jgi:hypothetical protein
MWQVRTGTQLGPLNHYLSCATGLIGLCDAVLDPAATVNLTGDPATAAGLVNHLLL